MIVATATGASAGTGQMGIQAGTMRTHGNSRQVLQLQPGRTKRRISHHSIPALPQVRTLHTGQLPHLQAELDKAVQEQRYEDAAVLRDQIKELKPEE